MVINNIMKKTILALALTMVLAACSRNIQPVAQPTPAQVETAQIGTRQSVDGGAYTNITPPELNRLLSYKDFTFVNVHIPFEGNIAKTDAFIPFDQIDQHLSQLPANKSAKIVLYCRSGRMSVIAAKTLIKLGYRNVWNLNGGMLAWEQAGLALEGK